MAMLESVGNVALDRAVRHAQTLANLLMGEAFNLEQEERAALVVRQRRRARLSRLASSAAITASSGEGEGLGWSRAARSGANSIGDTLCRRNASMARLRATLNK